MPVETSHASQTPILGVVEAGSPEVEVARQVKIDPRADAVEALGEDPDADRLDPEVGQTVVPHTRTAVLDDREQVNPVRRPVTRPSRSQRHVRGLDAEARREREVTDPEGRPEVDLTVVLVRRGSSKDAQANVLDEWKGDEAMRRSRRLHVGRRHDDVDAEMGRDVRRVVVIARVRQARQ